MGTLPLIVNIKRGSFEDGPGLRSVVFFKGCPLRCIFCHNPEGQNPGVEIAFYSKDCIFCGDCIRVCPRKALALDPSKKIDREKCDRCGLCVQACPGKGLRQVGTAYGIEELVEILLRDRVFYKYSGGGVTLSGGECTLYPDYVEALLKYLKPLGIHILLETSGFFSYKVFRRQILPHVDTIYYDLKFADPETHRQYTGKSNRRILDNFRSLIQEERVKVIPRIPLVPNVTATDENIAALAKILRQEGTKDALLLPYNPMGLGKFETIGRPRPHLPEHFAQPEEEKAISRMFYHLIQ